jgi:orotate phosphoribosyltransferase
MDRADLARRIYAAAHLSGEFTLRSGVVSEHYFDKYRFEADPQLLFDIVEAMSALVPPGVDVLAGLELGGVPLVTLLSQQTRLPARFVRKQAKEYGTCQLAEGGDIAGRRVLIVEDVVTSAGAVLDAIRELRQLDAHIVGAICVIDREAGGAANLEQVGVSLSSLYRMSDLDTA